MPRLRLKRLVAGTVGRRLENPGQREGHLFRCGKKFFSLDPRYHPLYCMGCHHTVFLDGKDMVEDMVVGFLTGKRGWVEVVRITPRNWKGERHLLFGRVIYRDYRTDRD